jgi:hypothetical protein
MATEGLAAPGTPASSGVMDKGLKKGAIGYLSNIVIGVASTAPAYSLAATLGFVVAVKGVGIHAPAVLLVSFIPMLLVASAYKYFNRADPDAGTTFAWVTRAMGPSLGWLNGWAIFLADIIVMASLADIAAIYTFKLFGFTELGESTAAILVAAVLWIALMTWICYRGIELSARIQQALLGIEVFILGLFSVVAFVKVFGSHPPSDSIKPSISWFNPFAMNFGDLLDAVLLGVFIYWGWDSGVSVNEESENPAEGPGKAAVISTLRPVLSRCRLPDQRSEPGRRPERPRQGRAGRNPRQAADHHRAHLRIRLDPDHDPADRAHHALDGALESGHDAALARAQALPDAHRLDARLRLALDHRHHSPAAALLQRP